MIAFSQSGEFTITDKFLKKNNTQTSRAILNRYGAIGVQALANATPRDSGKSASSWRYEVVTNKGYASLRWLNDNVVDGFPVVIMIHYGHGTKNGGYVQGRDFINPIVRPIFDRIAEELWKGVTE